jgi:hypothetical protein
MTPRRSKIALVLVFALALPARPAVHTVQNSFSAGQISPLLAGRTDLPKYFSAAKTLENVVVLPHGGVTKRPGTYYLGSAKSGSAACRLIPFVAAEDQGYVMELGSGYIRWFMPDANGNGGEVLDSNAVPYEVNSPWATSDLAGLKYVQCADVMYIAHPHYAIRKLVRAGHTSWTLSTPTWDYGPFLDRNKGDTTITPSATTGSITLVADANIWEPNHVGAQWQISHEVESATATATLTAADTNTAAVWIFRDQKYDFSTHGKWNGTVVLQRSYDSKATWRDVTCCHYEQDGNIQYTGEELLSDCWYRVRMTAYSAGSCGAALVSRGFQVDGVVQITAYSGPNDVNATVLHTLGAASATKYWAEGAWSEVRGYPTAMAFFEQRLVAAGTSYQPQTVWFSSSPGANGWESFRAGPLATDAFMYTIAAYQTSPILWLLGQEDLLVGTSGSEWKLFSPVAGEPISAANVPYCRRQSTYGSADLQGIVVNSAALFVQRHGRKLRECIYSSQVETYASADLTIMAEDITAPAIAWIAYQAEPYSILWMGRTDGDVAAMTYQRDNDVVACALETFGGIVESGCVIPGLHQDDLWLAVHRTIDGDEARYIEQMRPFSWGTDQADAFFVDCGISTDFGDAKAITGISKAAAGVVTCAAHGFLDGQQVRITGVSGMTEVNNRVFTVHAPAAGSFTLRDPTDASNWSTAGYAAYTSGGYVTRVGKTFTNVGHLEGQSVCCVGDGSYAGTRTVDANSVTLAGWYSNVHVGLAYTAKVSPMPLAAGSPYGSSTESRIKRVIDVGCRFFQTSDANVGPEWTATTAVVFREGPAPIGAIPLYTGDKEVTLGGDYGKETQICIQSARPLPFTLLSIMPTWEVYER